MLYMDRPPRETIHIGDDVTVRIVRIKGGRVRLGIDAPRALPVRDSPFTRPDPQPPHHLSVLLIEDNDDHALVIAQALADAGVTSVTRCADAPEARRRLDQCAHPPARAPDLIILDLNLPSGASLPLITDFRAHRATAHTPIVMLSADAAPAQIRLARERGADAYLIKQPAFDRLRETIYATVRFWDNNASPPTP